jgi:Zn-dependent peptidase ImmA (M78 family)
MAGYVYLTDQIKTAIGNIIDRVFQELDMRTPPVNYDWLYQNEKLTKQTLSLQDMTALSIKEVGSIQEQIRGLLFVPEKRVFVIDEEGYLKRINFVLGHEFGHWKLPSHRALLYKCTQFDLSPAARRQMEQEANFFSSEFGFMRQLFTAALGSSSLSLSHIKDLSNMFEMSVEATFRRAVELETRPCALLSLTVNYQDEKNFLSIRYPVHSQSFKESLGEINRRQKFSRSHPLSQILTDPVSNTVGECECDLGFGPNKIPLRAELWKNRWNIFALIQPLKQSQVADVVD